MRFVKGTVREATLIRLGRVNRYAAEGEYALATDLRSFEELQHLVDVNVLLFTVSSSEYPSDGGSTVAESHVSPTLYHPSQAHRFSKSTILQLQPL